jgi:hypothetical protein
MTGRRTLVIVFLFSLSSVVLSVSWFIFNRVDIDLIITENLYQFILTMSCLSFIVTVVSLHRLLFDLQYKINEVKDKEKNIRDIYQYDQLLNPPSMNN